MGRMLELYDIDSVKSTAISWTLVRSVPLNVFHQGHEIVSGLGACLTWMRDHSTQGLTPSHINIMTRGVLLALHLVPKVDKA